VLFPDAVTIPELAPDGVLFSLETPPVAPAPLPVFTFPLLFEPRDGDRELGAHGLVRIVCFIERIGLALCRIRINKLFLHGTKLNFVLES
jgi:hypothetical protein